MDDRGSDRKRRNYFAEVKTMIYVGVDIAKATHYACLMDDKHTLLTKPFSFSNDEAGFAKFRAAFQKHPKDKVVVGLESTSTARTLLLS